MSFHYNGSSSFLYDNGVKAYKFKAKDSEIKPNFLCLRNASKDVTVNIMKKPELNE